MKSLRKLSSTLMRRSISRWGSSCLPKKLSLGRTLMFFSWSAYEAPGVDPNFICHNLNVNPMVIPKKQPPQHSSKEHAKAVKEEVNKLKRARAIKEVFYPEWLANTIVVKKKSGKWRVYVDFTDLNKACLKCERPRPRPLFMMFWAKPT